MIVRFPQAQGEEGGGARTLEVFLDGSSRPRGPARPKAGIGSTLTKQSSIPRVLDANDEAVSFWKVFPCFSKPPEGGKKHKRKHKHKNGA